MKTKTLRGIIFFSALVLGLGLLGYLIYREGWGQILQTLMNFGLVPFLGFVAISAINFGLYSWRWQLILNHQVNKNQRLSLWRMYRQIRSPALSEVRDFRVEQYWQLKLH